jgi:hypothetical protein
MWKRLGCHALPNGAQAMQQDVRAIPIGFEAELATEFAQPEHGFGWSMLSQRKDELSCHQYQSEDTPQAFFRQQISDRRKKIIQCLFQLFYWHLGEAL